MVTVYVPGFIGMYETEYVPSLLSFNFTSTGLPSSSVHSTSTFPAPPALCVKTVNSAGRPER